MAERNQSMVRGPCYRAAISSQLTRRGRSMFKHFIVLCGVASIIGACSPQGSAPVAPSKAVTESRDQVKTGDKGLAMNVLCKTPARDRVAELRSHLQVIDLNVPNVSPEERKFLEHEQNAFMELRSNEAKAKALNTASNRRMAELLSRPLYYAWQVRDPLESAIANVDAIYRNEGTSFFEAEDANVLDRMIQASTDVSYVASASHEYLDHVSSSIQPELTLDQVGAVAAASGQIGWELQFAMQCELAMLMAAKH